MKIVNDEPNLLIVKDANLMGYVFGFIFIIVGVLTFMIPEVVAVESNTTESILTRSLVILMGFLPIVLSQSRKFVFDKNRGQLSVSARSLIIRKDEEHPLSQIKSVELRQVYDQGPQRSGIRRGGRYSSELVLVLQDNKEILMGSDNGGPIIANVPTGQRGTIGSRVAQFLGLPLDEMRPPTLKEALDVLKQKMGPQ